MQTLTHKLKHNTIQMLYKTNKRKENNLIKYAMQEHTVYVTHLPPKINYIISDNIPY